MIGRILTALTIATALLAAALVYRAGFSDGEWAAREQGHRAMERELVLRNGNVSFSSTASEWPF